VPDTTPISREFAKNLKPGDYALTNKQLREIYGVGILRSRITASFRREVAQELRKAGLEILSDPASEPLIVRKTAPARARVSRQRWWTRPKLIGIASVVLLLIMVGSLGSQEPNAPVPKSAAVTTEQGESVPEATPTAAPVETIADAIEAVEDRDYAGAVLIAASLGEDDEARVGRRISRHLARRVRHALRGGHRGRARNLLAESKSYPRTAQLRRARASYRAAQAAAKRRAELRRIARERRAEERRLARQRARELRVARRRARDAARALEEQASQAPAPSYDAPSTSGPSSVNWCGKRDGDGDGIYCE
jgi:hypothetical protein